MKKLLVFFLIGLTAQAQRIGLINEDTTTRPKAKMAALAVKGGNLWLVNPTGPAMKVIRSLTDLGLNNVNNTSDLNKPISTATQAALNLKANLASPTFTGTVSGITKSMVGLGNVDNTSDANKPVSSATQTALNLKANIASPTFTGTLTAPTGSFTNLYTNAFIMNTGSSLTDKILISDVNGVGSWQTPKTTRNFAYNSGAFSWQENGSTNITPPLATTSFVTSNYLKKDTLPSTYSLTQNTGILTLKKVVTLGPPPNFLPNTNYYFNYSDRTDSDLMLALGISNIDNTSDAVKPISTATQTALNLKANLASPTFTGTVSGITKSMVGLGNVDNTSDVNKPVSSATQTALNLKANIATPTFTGTLTAPTGSFTNLYTNAFTMNTGSSLTDKILISDVNGVGSWQTPKTTRNFSYSSGAFSWQENGSSFFTPTLLTTSSASSTYLKKDTLPSTYSLSQNTGILTLKKVVTSGPPPLFLPNTNYYFNYSDNSDSDLMLALGISNIDNTSDANKPISTATQTALDLKAPLASPTFTGVSTFTGGIVSQGAGSIASNLSIGATSLTANTTGSFNTALGVGTLNGNTTGSSNTAIGTNSLYANSTGTNNTAIGVNSLRYNTTGTYNSALGYYSLFTNTTGNYNNAFGQDALRLSQTGSNNNAFGYSAIYSNTTGINGAAFGHSAMYGNTTGSNNTAVGYAALYGNTTGGSNVAVGGYAGRYIADGSTPTTFTSNSVFLGYNTKALADNQTNQIVIGSNSVGLGNNSVVLGNPSTAVTALYGSVGIGSTSLTAYGLRVSKSISGGTISYGISSDGQIQSDVTSQARYFNTIATQATGTTTTNLYHYIATQGTFSGTVTNQYGVYIDASLVGASSINAGIRSSIPSSANRWNLYLDGTAQNYINGSVGIGAGTPSAKLEVIGDIVVRDTKTVNANSTNRFYSGAYSGNFFTNITATGTVSANLLVLGGGTGGGEAATTINFATATSVGTAGTGTTRMTINNSGLVGIGTASPANLLHVLSPSTSVIAIQTLETTGTGGRPYLNFKAEGNNFGYIGFPSSSSENMGIMNYRNALLSFGTNSLSRMVISESGNVGIGSTTPDTSALLDMSSTTQGVIFPRMTAAQRTAIASPATGLMVYQTDGTEGLYVKKSSGWVLAF